MCFVRRCFSSKATSKTEQSLHSISIGRKTNPRAAQTHTKQHPKALRVICRDHNQGSRITTTHTPSHAYTNTQKHTMKRTRNGQHKIFCNAANSAKSAILIKSCNCNPPRVKSGNENREAKERNKKIKDTAGIQLKMNYMRRWFKRFPTSTFKPLCMCFHTNSLETISVCR